MKGELVSIVTGDGYELQGLLCTSSKPQTDDKTSFNKAILHIHGLAGNFYENRFVSVVADELNAHGYTFLTVNNRGSGVLSELRKCTADGLELVEVGGAREVFEDCLYDIQAWINFLDSQGYSKIVLQGHSFGCYKVVFYQSCRSDPRVKALALISPPDVFGYQYAKYGGRFQSDLELAEKLVSKGKGTEFMPLEAYLYLIDANAFWRNLGPNSQMGILNYFDPQAPFTELAQIGIPIFACYGTVNEPVVKEPIECLEILKKKSVNSPKVKTVVVENATHRYLGHEKQLALLIREWVNEAL